MPESKRILQIFHVRQEGQVIWHMLHAECHRRAAEIAVQFWVESGLPLETQGESVRVQVQRRSPTPEVDHQVYSVHCQMTPAYTAERVRE